MADTEYSHNSKRTPGQRVLTITFKTPMKWTIEALDEARNKYATLHKIEKIIQIVLVKSDPAGKNWWLDKVLPHEPEQHTSMFMYFQKRFSRANYRLPNNTDDLNKLREWCDGIIQKNPHIASIEIADRL